MKARRITEITTEIEETIVIRRGSGAFRASCARCRSVVDLITPEHAAAIAGVPLSILHRWLASGELHDQTTEKGSLLVCVNSLVNLSTLIAGELRLRNQNEKGEKE